MFEIRGNEEIAKKVVWVSLSLFLSLMFMLRYLVSIPIYYLTKQ